MSTATDSIGRVLARRYRIESALGSGTSATVYAARDVVLKRRVALKVLHPALAGDESFLRRFRLEAQAAAALTHPHVLAVYDWGEDDGGPFLVLEFLGGGSMRDLLDSGATVSLAQAAALGAQAAGALAYAHGRGFVHRDIKPANLVFDEEGRLRIADFGLARALAAAALTEPAGATVGTARYAAPEQALGRPVDGRADVYGLALVLYEAVTGTVPFAADTTAATLMARVGAELPAHDGLGPLFPLLAAAAAPDVAERLEAAAFARRLTDLGARLPAPEPLPLAGPGGAGLAPSSRPPAGIDRTEHGMVTSASSSPPSSPPASPAPAASDRSRPPGPAAEAESPAVAVAWPPSAPAAAAEAAGAPAPAPRRRRRWPYVTAIVVLALALVGAAGAYAASRAKLFTPSHRIPAVTGLTPAQATARLRPDKLSLAVTRHHYSTTVSTGRILTVTPSPGTSVKEGTTLSATVSSGPPPVVVPSLSGLTGDCAAAVAALQTAHLRANCTHTNSTTVAAGTVISWSPHGRTPEFSTVSVTVSSGPPIKTIPSLTGSTCAAASATLQALGLEPQCTPTYSASVPSGQVISWSPTGSAPQGSTVTIAVSEGPPPVTIPQSIIGEPIGQAIATLDGIGLVPTDQGPLSGRVFDTSPSPGTSVPEGSTVTLYTR